MPVQVPVVPVSVLPWTSEPEIVGSAVFFGALEETTTDVEAESALACPAPFVAVTRIRSLKPTSELAATYVELVAPLIETQFAAFESQRRHW